MKKKIVHLLNIVNPIQAPFAGHNPGPLDETSVLLWPGLTVPYTPAYLSSIQANMLRLNNVMY